MKWTETQLAYMAGIVDGEGTIAIFTSRNSTKGKKYPCYCPRLNVFNCDERLMVWIVEHFGGKARPVSRRQRILYPNSRQCYIWEISRRAAIPVIEAILPFLVIKKAQAQLFLEFRKATPTRNIYGVLGLPDNVVQMRSNIIDQIKFLNRKGARAVGSE